MTRVVAYITDVPSSILSLRIIEHGHKYNEFLFRFNVTPEYPEHEVCCDYALESPHYIPAGSCYSDTVHLNSFNYCVFARQSVVLRNRSDAHKLFY